jgi:Domain of unknown function DUF11
MWSFVKFPLRWLQPLAAALTLVFIAAQPPVSAADKVNVIRTPPRLISIQDLSVTITDNLQTVNRGDIVEVIITITNRGTAENWPSVAVQYFPPPSYSDVTWLQESTENPGIGAIERTRPVSQSKPLVFTVTAAVRPTASGVIKNTVTITPAESVGDIDTANNIATDTTLVNLPVTTTRTTPPTTSVVPSATTTLVVSTTAPSPASTAVLTPSSIALNAAPTTVASPASTTAVLVAPTTVASPAPSSVEGFQSPSGSTKCLLMSDPVIGQTMRCTVIGSTAKLPKRPATCDFDWGDIAVNATGRAYTVCAGDSIERQLPVLDYGNTWKRSVFICTSAKSGVTCRNASKRGFRVSPSKRSYL